MITHTRLAFLNEWGNNGLDFTKKGISTHFIVTALILTREELPQAEETVERARQKHFQKDLIQSAKIGNDHLRRMQILADLLAAPFRIFALVVDKRQLIGEGLRYKGSFYKFLHGLADRELFRTFPNLDMVASQHGSDTFMEGFISYVQRNHIPNLFNESSFGFVPSRDSVMIQAADFKAGTLARCYDETVITSERQS